MSELQIRMLHFFIILMLMHFMSWNFGLLGVFYEKIYYLILSIYYFMMLKKIVQIGFNIFLIK